MSQLPLLQFINQEMTLTCPLCERTMTVQPANKYWLECDCGIVEQNPNTNRYFNNDKWENRVDELQDLKKQGYFDQTGLVPV